MLLLLSRAFWNVSRAVLRLFETRLLTALQRVLRRRRFRLLRFSSPPHRTGLHRRAPASNLAVRSVGLEGRSRNPTEQEEGAGLRPSLE